MDRNTIIGLGLIGVILATFTYFNRPSAEELERLRTEQEQLVQQEKDRAEQQEEVSKTKKDTPSSEPIALLDEEGNPLLDSLGNQIFDNDSITNFEELIYAPTDFVPSSNITEELTVLENNEIEVVLTNKGGGVKTVYLKNHQSYDDYNKNKGTDKIDKLQLFDEENATNGLIINYKGKEYNTRRLEFSIHKQTENYISYRAEISDETAGNNKYIEQIYTIIPDQYHIDYEIKFNGFDGEINPEHVRLDWEADLLKTEKELKQQRMASTIFFQETGGKYDYLSEMKDDDKVAKTDMDWIAFKQSYFSSIMMPDKPFKKEGTVLKISSFDESSSKDTTHVKSYFANINPGLSNTASGSIEMKWFFGPNDYELLKSYDNGTKDLLNYGWGLFRWINIYIIQPLFVWLTQYGLNMGIAILVLTIIVKLVLTPVQWKMFVSSAKMRILKPEIEEINQKYPEKEQAMDKQMEMMALYKETGSSPLAGCLPALIQMPLLVAVFRFFPSTFMLRQKSFLWADDLSSYDSVLDLGFNIPFYGDHISLFTLLMAATTLGYTFINSSNQMAQPSQPGMPNMKIIMYMMPIMMIFWFNSYSSGLSYYYFISTLMSILIMIAIKNFFVDEEKLKAKMAERKASNQGSAKKKGKSRFQQRLEEMQKMQQEKLKESRKK